MICNLEESFQNNNSIINNSRTTDLVPDHYKINDNHFFNFQSSINHTLNIQDNYIPGEHYKFPINNIPSSISNITSAQCNLQDINIFTTPSKNMIKSKNFSYIFLLMIHY